MFTRRHPYLFFLLTLFALLSVSVIIVSYLLVKGLQQTQFSDFVTESGGGKVGVVEIKGIIIDSRETIRLIKRFREDETIKAIVLRVESPGGVVGPSQEIYREIRKTVPQKKVVASMGSVAASGGYYVAAAANGIVANPGTITGSIGVIMGYTNIEQLFEKIGLVPVVIKSGEYKDMGSPTRQMTSREKKTLQYFVDQTHRQFVTAISEGRDMDLSHVESLADGRIYTGEEALKQGLVDRLGNLEDAIEWAGRLGGIDGKISAVYKREETFSVLKYLLKSAVKDLILQTMGQPLHGGYIYRPGEAF
ncbi:MAG: signal peptide peptidase SppA [Deltaproteobacteria bacterium]|nr:signal peptide peptidase SppA [Deltaproteobacteria bacterium]